MKKTTCKVTATIGAAMLLAASIVGCGNAANTTDTAAPAATTESTTAAAETTESTTAAETTAQTTETPAADNTASDLTGSVTMAGSTSMEKLANALSESFMAEYPGVTVNAEFTGSGAGIESLIAGSVDIGNSSRSLKDEEKSQGAVENVVAIDGIGVIVDPDNGLDGLTKEQLVDIYTGNISNWSELGGTDEPIVVVGREAGSGTRDGFESILDVKDTCAYANELDSTGAVIAKVASTPGAIGYASFGDLNDSVKTLALDEVTPSIETIKDGSYILQRPFVMATMGEVSEQNEAVQALFAYLKSDAGKQIVESVGLVTVD